MKTSLTMEEEVRLSQYRSVTPYKNVREQTDLMVLTDASVLLLSGFRSMAVCTGVACATTDMASVFTTLLVAGGLRSPLTRTSGWESTPFVKGAAVTDVSSNSLLTMNFTVDPGADTLSDLKAREKATPSDPCGILCCDRGFAGMPPRAGGVASSAFGATGAVTEMLNVSGGGERLVVSKPCSVCTSRTSISGEGLTAGFRQLAASSASLGLPNAPLGIGAPPTGLFGRLTTGPGPLPGLGNIRSRGIDT